MFAEASNCGKYFGDILMREATVPGKVFAADAKREGDEWRRQFALALKKYASHLMMKRLLTQCSEETIDQMKEVVRQAGFWTGVSFVYVTKGLPVTAPREQQGQAISANLSVGDPFAAILL